MKKKKLFSASESHASSEAYASSSGQAFGEYHASSSTGCPPFGPSQPHLREVCTYGTVCGDGACLRMFCEACKIIPFIPFYTCACPKYFSREYDTNLKAGKCIRSDSSKCISDGISGATDCEQNLSSKPCMCPKNEMCTMSNLDDSCAGANCTPDSFHNNPEPKWPWCTCLNGFKRLPCGTCVDQNSKECKALIHKSQHYCENLKTVREPCRCDSFYEH